MRAIAILLSSTVLFTTQAGATTVDERRCIFAAAQKLPLIPGLAITGSRFDLQKNVKFGGIVEIDVRAAAQDATFSFCCGANDKIAIATPLGITR